jgi:putative acetyltransferase
MSPRDERVPDHPAVRAIHRRAFGGAHGEVVATLVDALRRDDPTAAS